MDSKKEICIFNDLEFVVNNLTIAQLLEAIKLKADCISDGHFTLEFFTTDVRAAFGTPSCRKDTYKMAWGRRTQLRELLAKVFLNEIKI